MTPSPDLLAAHADRMSRLSFELEHLRSTERTRRNGGLAVAGRFITHPLVVAELVAGAGYLTVCVLATALREGAHR